MTADMLLCDEIHIGYRIKIIQMVDIMLDEK